MTSVLQRLRLLRGPLAILAAISFVSSLGIGVMLPVIPLYAIALGATPFQVGLMTSGFAIANTATQLLSGLAMDRYGTLPFLRYGTGLYAVANGLAATATSALSLIAYRALAGLGAGGNLVASRVYVAQVAPRERLATANGILGAAQSGGTILGPAVGGIVAHVLDLRGPFIIVAITSGIAAAAAFTLPRPPAAAPTASAARPQARPGAWLLERTIVALLLANLCLSATFGGFITTYAPYTTDVLGWTTLEVGLIFSIVGAGSITLGPWLGHLADRTGRRRIAVLGLVPAVMFGIALVAGLPREVLYVVTYFTGAGIAAFHASWFALLNEASPPERRGRTFGVVSAISNLGTVIGALAATSIWEIVSIEGGVLTPSVAAALGAFALLALPKEPSRSRSDAPSAS